VNEPSVATESSVDGPSVKSKKEFPLSHIEIKALKRVGLFVPAFRLDDFIQMYLAETAEVYVAPATSAALEGKGSELLLTQAE